MRSKACLVHDLLQNVLIAGRFFLILGYKRSELQLNMLYRNNFLEITPFQDKARHYLKRAASTTQIPCSVYKLLLDSSQHCVEPDVIFPFSSQHDKLQSIVTACTFWPLFRFFVLLLCHELVIPFQEWPPSPLLPDTIP